MLQNTQFDNRAIVRYSNALYGIATDNKTETHLYEEIKNLLDIIKSDDKFFKVLNSPLLSKKEQISMVANLFSEKKERKILVSKHLFGLIMLLAKNTRIHLLTNVLEAYLKLQTSENKEVNLIVTSVSHLNDDITYQLKKIFSKNGKLQVKVTNLIDKDLLGGLIIQMGSNLIDTSVRTKLNKIKSAMKGAN